MKKKKKTKYDGCLSVVVGDNLPEIINNHSSRSRVVIKIGRECGHARADSQATKHIGNNRYYDNITAFIQRVYITVTLKRF